MTLQEFKNTVIQGGRYKDLSKLIGTLSPGDRAEAGKFFQGYCKDVKEIKKVRPPHHPFWKGWRVGWFSGPIFIWKDKIDVIRVEVSDQAYDDGTETGGELIITGDNLRAKWHPYK